MREQAPDFEQPERRKVIVFIHPDDQPDLDIYPESMSLEISRTMGAWFREKTAPAREVIEKVGGTVVRQSWFWCGMEVQLPSDDIESRMETIRNTMHVNGVIFP